MEIDKVDIAREFIAGGASALPGLVQILMTLR